MKMTQRLSVFVALLFSVGYGFAQERSANAPPVAITNRAMTIEVSQDNGSYTIRSGDKTPDSFRARLGASVDHRWLYSDEYPSHTATASPFTDELGEGSQLTVTHSGLPGQPELICILRLHSSPVFAEIEVQVRNSTAKPVTVQSIRVLEATGDPTVNLNGPESSDRVLSDSFSEDRPGITIHDVLQPLSGNMHRAVGSQLIYNRNSQRSLFLGTLTSERWLTVLRLRIDQAQKKITGYEVDSTGTTELTKENSLETSSAEDRIELSLPVAAGETLPSERLLASLGSDYHAQLESYGGVIRRLHHARVGAPTPIGWWSWTAYYFGINEGAALTNAIFQAEHLKNLGYTFFHIDEGYQYARGEYATPDAAMFPHGMKALESGVRGLGLTPGIWTSPFQVSERSWVYQNHPDWFVHNAAGKPIHAGWVAENEETQQQSDQLYVLDTTHPGAQDHLRKTYSTLVKDWGIRYIKLDFMEDAAIEGYYYRPNTTALEAQRIGLQIIRETVGEDVLLDKDGSTMLNPVGIVDLGRISVDTGHTFDASKEAATGIAARYYMNRNFYVTDPDAFTVSRQFLQEQRWHGGGKPLTLDEAKVSIALAAVSGGMFEIGDDLPTLFLDADRMALVRNRDLLSMARYGHAARPVDLMSYSPEDAMPSVFLLRESRRQVVLTVFNWTENQRQHKLPLSELGLHLAGHNQIFDMFGSNKAISENQGSISTDLAPHSVQMMKIVDTSVAASAPTVRPQVPASTDVGKATEFTAQANPDGTPAVSYHWEFGDGTSSEGGSVTHTYTRAGSFTIRLEVDGVDGAAYSKTFVILVNGEIDPRFTPARNRRFSQ